LINLFINYYISLNKERQDEIDYCFRKNLDNLLIDKIYVFVSKKINFPFGSGDGRIQLIDLERPKYSDILHYFNSRDEFKESYNVISNSDIYFDYSISFLDRIDMNNTCVVLNRWNIKKDENPSHSDKIKSQDVWIFKGHTKKELEASSNFYMGKKACDCVFLNKLYKTGYRSVCPSYDIKAYHLHLSNYRTWKDGNDDILGKRMYIRLCNIEDIEKGKDQVNYYINKL